MATYVISDIHSHFDVFQTFLDTLSEEDEVIIDGDTIDKGPDGIKVLNYVRKSESITLVMGNHELMMLDYLEAKRNLETVHFPSPSYFTKRSWLEKKADHWLQRNYGRYTYADYAALAVQEQNEIYEYLKSLPVLIHREVNGKKFIIVHAGLYNYQGKDVYYRDVGDESQKYVWGWEPYQHEKDAIIITGHRIVPYVFYKTEVESDGSWYDIDMGLAMNSKQSQLAALCLEDLSVTYFPLENYADFDYRTR